MAKLVIDMADPNLMISGGNGGATHLAAVRNLHYGSREDRGVSARLGGYR
jgi:hypothetical protein